MYFARIFPPGSSRAFFVWKALHSTPYGLALHGKNAVFPLTLGRAALCRHLAFPLLQKPNAPGPASTNFTKQFP